MKKVWVKVVAFIAVLAIFPFTLHGYGTEQVMSEEDYQVIPDEAIRLRILANSDEEKDQELKRKVRDAVNAHITEWVSDITDIEDAYTEIDTRLEDVEQIVDNVLTEEGAKEAFSVKFGEVEFPAKLYGNYVYPAGLYEAILITIGEGKGANWWCVLFPPLCFLDFNNGTSVAHAEEKEESIQEESKSNIEELEKLVEKEAGQDEVEVKFFLFEWVGNLFS
ncbi:stage II sporulation protein R [Pontibacillus salicampi]|uniref:Stage II sporulation protein R n=1 Tax=Pontibacillus salicampi TaxID=1449801 RepID=A0ABV6LS39_9BACI